MSRSSRIVMASAGLVVAALWTVPPFAVIDDGSGGVRHTALGHHPAWAPPTAAEADSLLAFEVGPPEAGTSVRLRVIRNNVLLGLETLLVLLAAVALWVFVSRRTHGAPPPDS